MDILPVLGSSFFGHFFGVLAVSLVVCIVSRSAYFITAFLHHWMICPLPIPRCLPFLIGAGFLGFSLAGWVILIVLYTDDVVVIMSELTR